MTKSQALIPEPRPVFVCTKGGQICYLAVDWDDAKRYKATFGCTIWSGVVDDFKELDFESQDYLSRVAKRSTTK